MENKETDNSNSNESLEEKLLSEIDNNLIIQELEGIRRREYKKIISTVYIVLCMIIIFISLLLLDSCRVLSSILIVLGLMLLQFENYILSFIYKNLDLYNCENNN